MAPGPINFTMFLTMFGEKLNGTDPEDVIKNAFACFDDSGSGTLDADHLKELLMTMGDRFSEEQVDELLKGAPIDDKNHFDYKEFTKILKHGAKDKEDSFNVREDGSSCSHLSSSYVYACTILVNISCYQWYTIRFLIVLTEFHISFIQASSLNECVLYSYNIVL